MKLMSTVRYTRFCARIRERRSLTLTLTLTLIVPELERDEMRYKQHVK